MKHNIDIYSNNDSNLNISIDSEFIQDREEDDDNRSYIALWRAVIMQAMLDIASMSSRTEDKLEKYRSISWIMNDNEDFNLVCRLANYDPKYVRNRAFQVIKSSAGRKKTLSTKKIRVRNAQKNTLNLKEKIRCVI